jgi:hypothetical protein
LRLTQGEPHRAWIGGSELYAYPGWRRERRSSGRWGISLRRGWRQERSPGWRCRRSREEQRGGRGAGRGLGRRESGL